MTALKYGMLLYTTYVNIIIDLSYHDDKSVKELQSFAHDIHTNGFPAYDGSYLNGHDFPPSIRTKAELVEICILIMFTRSAQHAAVNFGQYTYYSFVPNAPPTLHHPPPTEKGKLTFKKLMDALPNEEGTQNIITVISVLSKYSPDEVSNRYICVFLTFHIQFFILRSLWGHTQLSYLLRRKLRLLLNIIGRHWRR